MMRWMFFIRAESGELSQQDKRRPYLRPHNGGYLKKSPQQRVDMIESLAKSVAQQRANGFPATAGNRSGLTVRALSDSSLKLAHSALL